MASKEEEFDEDEHDSMDDRSIPDEGVQAQIDPLFREFAQNQPVNFTRTWLLPIDQ